MIYCNTEISEILFFNQHHLYAVVILLTTAGLQNKRSLLCNDITKDVLAAQLMTNTKTRVSVN